MRSLNQARPESFGITGKPEQLSITISNDCVKAELIIISNPPTNPAEENLPANSRLTGGANCHIVI
jgi:hypothetical protein